MATVAQLRARLADLGVDAPARARKPDLERLVAEAEAPEAGELLDKLRSRAVVLSVFGAFNARTMVVLPTELAMQLLGANLPDHAPSHVVDGVERDLAEIREADEGLAESGLAAAAVQMAFELAHPYNSATSKAQCAKALHDLLDRLRELAPDEGEEGDGLDELSARRAERRAG